MTEQEQKEFKECSDFVSSKLTSFTYIKKVEEYYESIYHVTYLMDNDILISISMMHDELQKNKQVCGVTVFQKRECILSDFSTLEMIDTWLKNVQKRLAEIEKDEQV